MLRKAVVQRFSGKGNVCETTRVLLTTLLMMSDLYHEHPFQIKTISRRKGGEYWVWTDCKHCMFRGQEVKQGRLCQGHMPKETHTDNHIFFVVQPTTISLRCNAKWHTIRAQRTLQSTDMMEFLRKHQAQLFPARMSLKSLCAPVSKRRKLG